MDKSIRPLLSDKTPEGLPLEFTKTSVIGFFESESVI